MKLIEDDDKIQIAARELECKTEALIRMSQQIYDALLNESRSWAYEQLPHALDHIQLCALDLRKHLRQLKKLRAFSRPRKDAVTGRA